MKISELYAEIGFKFDTIKLHEVMTAVSNLNLSSVVALGSMALMGEGVKKLIDLFGEWNTMLSDTSLRLMTLHENTGIPTKFAQQFENVSYELGASKQSADETINKLSQLRRGIMMGQGVPQQLQFMGFSVNDLMGTNENMIDKINKALSVPQEKMTLAQREHMAAFKSYLSSLFGGPEMLQVFESKNLMGQINQAPFVPTKDLQEGYDATVRWRKAMDELNNSFMELGAAISPLVIETAHLVDNLAKMIGWFSPDSQKKDVHGNMISEGSSSKNFGWLSNYINKQIEHDKENPYHIDPRFLPPNKQVPTTKSITVHAPITINSKDSKDVVKELEAWWQKTMANTSREFGLGQT